MAHDKIISHNNDKSNIKFKPMSITQFCKYCKDHKISTYYFSSENQHFESLFSITERFSKMHASLKPNRICLIGNCGTMCFHDVQFVAICDNDSGMSRTICDIVCDKNKEDTVIYRVLIDSVK